MTAFTLASSPASVFSRWASVAWISLARWVSCFRSANS